MPVKSDKWIRRMALEYGMIVPFEERLIREVEGRRIISAGLSSYGYDIRLAKDGFFIFSPIKGREIDPKNFDTSSLIEAPLRTRAHRPRSFCPCRMNFNAPACSARCGSSSARCISHRP